MAIVTGNYKGFTFGDISSKAYGVYITQEAAYDAPERDTEVVEIAGRNGAYILDKGRFKNIVVSYKCGIALDSEQTFESAIRAFRNALSAKAGKYVRLEDEYNPNEFRQAAFLGGIDVNMADRRAGEFTVSFDCKPQRFLKSGETAVSVASGGTITNPTLFEASPLLQVWGYGGLAINGEPLAINSVPVGKIVLENSYYSGWQSGHISKSVNYPALNNGDKFYIAWPVIEVFIYGDSIPTTGSYQINTVAGFNYDIECLRTTEQGHEGYWVECKRSSHILEFENNALDIHYNDTFELTIGGSTTIRFGVLAEEILRNVLWFGIGTLPDGANAFSRVRYDEIYGISSKSALGEPLYFDLDIGEAYKVEDGAVVSVNNAVTIPAELPKLASGANTITYDNTITQFKVVPRWWEV